MKPLDFLMLFLEKIWEKQLYKEEKLNSIHVSFPLFSLTVNISRTSWVTQREEKVTI